MRDMENKPKTIYDRLKVPPRDELTAEDRRRLIASMRLAESGLANSSWFESRPESVRQAIQRTPPGWYKNRKTGQFMVPISYQEDDDGKSTTMRVFAGPSGMLGALWPEGHQVFGVHHDDLEPFDDDSVPDEVLAAFRAHIDDLE